MDEPQWERVVDRGDIFRPGRAELAVVRGRRVSRDPVVVHGRRRGRIGLLRWAGLI